MSANRYPKPVPDGILLTQTGPVHREVGRHRTACGDVITVAGIPVSEAQVYAFDLPVCVPCYPDQHSRGGPKGGRHRASRALR